MTTILALNDWFEVIRRGTSGDQVSDILYSWKEQSEKKDAELEKEIEGLKKMLAYIRDYSDEGIDEDLNGGWSRVKQIQMLAQQALNEMETCPACGGSTYTECMAANGGMTQIPCANCCGSGEVTK